MIHATCMNDVGPPHVIENPPGHMHSVQKNVNLIDLDVYIISTHLLTFKILRARLTLFLILIVLFYYPLVKLNPCFS